MVCGLSIEAFLKKIELFHGWKAPGLVLGGFMVDWAKERLDPGVEADAIVETRHCLPDAVQIFTPCTIGNGWLKVLDWDKFALSLYDRKRLHGIRVWFDVEKAKQFPNLYNWFMRLVPKKELPLEVLLGTILEAGRAVFSIQPIRVTDFYKRIKKEAVAICPDCGEAFPVRQGLRCLACQGGGYYRFLSMGSNDAQGRSR